MATRLLLLCFIIHLIRTSSGDICRDDFTHHANMYVRGGYRHEDADSVEACTSACLEWNNPPCTAFDFELDYKWCYLHFSINHTHRSRYDYIHFDRNFRCNKTVTDDCPDGFKAHANTYVRGGNHRYDADSLEACASACLEWNNPSCTAFDFALDLNWCYLHFSTNHRHRARSLYIHFDRCNVTVSVVTAKPTTSVSTEAVPTLTPTHNLGVLEAEHPDLCSDDFTAHANTYVDGGNIQLLIRSVDACTSACLGWKNPRCTAFDFISLPGLCFLHFSTNHQHTSMPNVIHYDRNSKCNGTVTAKPTTNNATGIKPTLPTTDHLEAVESPESRPTSTISPHSGDLPMEAHGACQDNFTQHADTVVPGGLDHTSVKSPDGCMSVCLNLTNPPCTAFYLRPGQDRCYILFSTNLQTTTEPGVTLYKRNFKCNGTVVQSKMPGEVSWPVVGAAVAAAVLIIVILVTTIYIWDRKNGAKRVDDQAANTGKTTPSHTFEVTRFAAHTGIYLHPPDSSEYDEIRPQSQATNTGGARSGQDQNINMTDGDECRWTNNEAYHPSP